MLTIQVISQNSTQTTLKLSRKFITHIINWNLKMPKHSFEFSNIRLKEVRVIVVPLFIYLYIINKKRNLFKLCWINVTEVYSGYPSRKIVEFEVKQAIVTGSIYYFVNISFLQNYPILIYCWSILFMIEITIKIVCCTTYFTINTTKFFQYLQLN